jgi:cytochrome c biogenesis protein CcdA
MKHLPRRLLPFLLLLFSASAHALEIPRVLDLGESREGAMVSRELEIRNAGAAVLTLDFLSGCDCLTVTPANLRLAPLASASLRFAFDPEGYTGQVKKYVLIRSNNSELDRKIINVLATVAVPEGQELYAERCESCEIKQQQLDEELMRQLVDTWVVLDYYYSPGCRECETFLAREIPRLMKELDVHITLNSYDVFEPRFYEQLETTAAGLGVTLSAFPVLRVENRLLQGGREITDNLERMLRDLAAAPAAGPGASGQINASRPREGGAASRLAPLPVFAAGLVDGINPCAFTTLLFLLSMLALVGRDRREILVIGLLFAAAVLATYFAVGAGFLKIVRSASAFPLISRIIKYALVGVLLLFAGLSVYDAVQIRRGKTARVILQLPGALKRQIHKTIRSRARASSLVAGTLAMGVLVSVFELACTGQVYLPTITYMVRVRPEASVLGLLALYNAGFILPLLAVFGLVYAGLSSQRIVRFFETSLVKVKLALAGLFLLMAGLTLLT